MVHDQCGNIVYLVTSLTWKYGHFHCMVHVASRITLKYGSRGNTVHVVIWSMLLKPKI